MRLFYVRYPICEKLSHKLTWSHYCELIKIDNDLERSFYYQQNILENWSVPELRRQKDSGLFMRIGLLKNKLVFYHRILRCFVLIDLKINEVRHDDIWQMNMYMGYFSKEENEDDDNPPIGIILSKDKDELLVEYATYGMSSQLFVSKYQLYLPNKEELRKLINSQLNNNE
jgi:hypothetical protein